MRLRNLRFHCRCPVLFQSNGAVMEGALVNLSLRGCSIETPRSCIPGDVVRLHVWLPTETLRVEVGRVRWCEPYRFGVEFVQVPPDQKGTIARMLKGQLEGVPSHS